MKLYKIRNWNALYENNRSRSVVKLSWVSIPNRHDGENFSNIMAHKDGAVIFSAFILMIQVASKCSPRGTLIKDNGEPHTVSSLSAKCRCPDVWFKTSLDYLENKTDWLEVEQVNDRVSASCQRPISVLSASCEGRTERTERTEGKGQKEQKEQKPALPENLRRDDFEKSWGEWTGHLKEKKSKPTPSALQKQITFCSTIGATRAIIAINHSIEHNWQGIYEPKENQNGNGTPPVKPTKCEFDKSIDRLTAKIMNPKPNTT